MSRDLRGFAQWSRPRRAVNAPASLLGYFVEVAPDEYAPTVDASEATHGLVDVGGGEWEITPIADLDGSVTMRRIGADTYIPY